MRHVAMALAILVGVSALAAEQPKQRKRRAPPQEYGRVVISNYSEKAGVAPVVFDHWIHRSKYTCRVCHVDVGFGMKAGASDIRAADNAAGQFCGACHNGRNVSPAGKKIFESCSNVNHKDVAWIATNPPCIRCHSLGKDVKPEADFAALAAKLPKERFGNGIDWEKAEIEKLVKLSDFVEGVSIKRPPLKSQKDFALTAKLEGMPNILFSHVKHTVWNGCELCHPQMFAVRKGSNKLSMVQIFEGQFCGACHTTVAFPLIDCQRCHTQPVQ
jgi:c(7)-type cytochrome triheme protein